jgi:hypothetical protein
MSQFHKFHSSVTQFGSTSTAFPTTYNNTLLSLLTRNAFQLVSAYIGTKYVNSPKYVNKNLEPNLYQRETTGTECNNSEISMYTPSEQRECKQINNKFYESGTAIVLNISFQHLNNSVVTVNIFNPLNLDCSTHILPWSLANLDSK